VFELHGNAIMSSCTGCSTKAPTVDCVAQAEVCTQDAEPATSVVSSKPTDAIVCASLLATQSHTTLLNSQEENKRTFGRKKHTF
jgi:hypothetical protein